VAESELNGYLRANPTGVWGAREDMVARAVVAEHETAEIPRGLALVRIGSVGGNLERYCRDQHSGITLAGEKEFVVCELGVFFKEADEEGVVHLRLVPIVPDALAIAVREASWRWVFDIDHVCSIHP
jgi:hypothetical protein